MLHAHIVIALGEHNARLEGSPLIVAPLLNKQSIIHPQPYAVVGKNCEPIGGCRKPTRALSPNREAIRWHPTAGRSVAPIIRQRCRVLDQQRALCQPAIAEEFNAPGGGICCTETLDTLVSIVGHTHCAARPSADTPRVLELSIAGPPGAPRPQKGAGSGEALDALNLRGSAQCAIGHVDGAIGRSRHGQWIVEKTPTGSLPTPLSQVRTVSSKALDTHVLCVYHVDRTIRGDGYVIRLVELSRP